MSPGLVSESQRPVLAQQVMLESTKLMMVDALCQSIEHGVTSAPDFPALQALSMRVLKSLDKTQQPESETRLDDAASRPNAATHTELNGSRSRSRGTLDGTLDGTLNGSRSDSRQDPFNNGSRSETRQDPFKNGRRSNTRQDPFDNHAMVGGAPAAADVPTNAGNKWFDTQLNLDQVLQMVSITTIEAAGRVVAASLPFVGGIGDRWSMLSQKLGKPDSLRAKEAEEDANMRDTMVRMVLRVMMATLASCDDTTLAVAVSMAIVNLRKNRGHAPTEEVRSELEELTQQRSFAKIMQFLNLVGPRLDKAPCELRDSDRIACIAITVGYLLCASSASSMEDKKFEQRVKSILESSTNAKVLATDLSLIQTIIVGSSSEQTQVRRGAEPKFTSIAKIIARCGDLYLGPREKYSEACSSIEQLYGMAQSIIRRR
jgi:hypothetical protein